MKLKKYIAIGAISVLALAMYPTHNIFGAGANNVIQMEKNQVEIGSILSSVTIKNKDNIYIGDAFAQISIATKDTNIEKIVVDNNIFDYSASTDTYDGEIYFKESQVARAYIHKAQNVEIHYKDGKKVSIDRNTSNESTFQKFDINIKMNTIEYISIAAEDNILCQGDRARITIKMNKPWVMKDTLGNRIYNPDLYVWYKGAEESERTYLSYNKEKDIYEGTIDAKFKGEYTLQSINVHGNGGLIKINLFDREYDKDILKQGDYTVKESKYNIKSIKILNKRDMHNFSKIHFEANVFGPDRIESISIKYSDGSDISNDLIYNLGKAGSGDRYEGTGKLPNSTKYYKLKSITIHKYYGGSTEYDINKDPILGVNLNLNNIQVNEWLRLDDKWYYFDSKGEMVIGWKRINGTWYYLEDNGVMKKDWQKISGKWYYMDNSGAMVTGWKQINEKWYYMEQSGEMAIGWREISSKWYYMEDSGDMVTGWKQIHGVWYYMENSGAMAIGWKQINGTWYYMDKTGAMLKGWQKVNGEWYYLYSGGAMAKNTTIDGWKINSSGVARKIA